MEATGRLRVRQTVDGKRERRTGLWRAANLLDSLWRDVGTFSGVFGEYDIPRFVCCQRCGESVVPKTQVLGRGFTNDGKFRPSLLLPAYACNHRGIVLAREDNVSYSRVETRSGHSRVRAYEGHLNMEEGLEAVTCVASSNVRVP